MVGLEKVDPAAKVMLDRICAWKAADQAAGIADEDEEVSLLLLLRRACYWACLLT
jgi:hypothetical protein